MGEGKERRERWLKIDGEGRRRKREGEKITDKVAGR